jgi:hypothetical protein
VLRRMTSACSHSASLKQCLTTSMPQSAIAGPCPMPNVFNKLLKHDVSGAGSASVHVSCPPDCASNLKTERSRFPKRRGVKYIKNFKFDQGPKTGYDCELYTRITLPMDIRNLLDTVVMHTAELMSDVIVFITSILTTTSNQNFINRHKQ